MNENEEMKRTAEVAAEELLASRQQVIDVDKWLDSEAAGYDLCGSKEYCASCDKAMQYPCARAERSWQEQSCAADAEDALAEEVAADEACEEANPEEEVAAEVEVEVAATSEEEDAPADEVVQTEALPEAPTGYALITRYRRAFRARLIQSETAQPLYNIVRNALAGLVGVKSRLSFQGESFRLKGELLAKLGMGGKTLCLYLNLDPAQYAGSKYRYTDVSDRKTYAETPMKVRITSRRAAKYACELLSDLAAKYSIAHAEHIEFDYTLPYKTDEELIAEGLVKPYYAIVKLKK